jgi:hypothetical protein
MFLPTSKHPPYSSLRPAANLSPYSKVSLSSISLPTHYQPPSTSRFSYPPFLQPTCTPPHPHVPPHRPASRAPPCPVSNPTTPSSVYPHVSSHHPAPVHLPVPTLLMLLRRVETTSQWWRVLMLRMKQRQSCLPYPRPSRRWQSCQRGRRLLMMMMLFIVIHDDCHAGEHLLLSFHLFSKIKDIHFCRDSCFTKLLFLPSFSLAEAEKRVFRPPRCINTSHFYSA